MMSFIKKITKFVLIFSIILTLFTYYSHIPIYAEDTPDGNAISTSITQDANSQIQQSLSDSSSSSNQTEVVNTGDDSSSQTSSQTDNTTTVNNQNDADIQQTTEATANTGNNEASRNISIGGDAGIITTGDASVNTLAVADANNNTTGVSGSSPSGTLNTEVANTGNSLSTTSTNSSTTTTAVTNNNSATINQATSATANTGNNTADRNISIGGQAGVITTGNASVSTNYLATANGSVVLIGGESDGNGPGSGASIFIFNTGNDSVFNMLQRLNNNTYVTNNNSATIQQSCGVGLNYESYSDSCVANTGSNSADRNIGLGGDAGVINTGDAVVGVYFYAGANNNTTSINNNGGQVTGTSAGILNTGDNFNGEISNEANTDTNVTNNNGAYVIQTVNAYANTGNNTANRNISFGGNAGVIQTGDATIYVTMIADVNRNTTEINQNSPLSQSGIVINLENTGDNFNFISNNTTSTATTVNNTNVTFVIQQLWVWVNTGFNTASGNIGEVAGIINTGDAKAEVKLVANANENTTLINNGSSPTPSPTPSPTSVPEPTTTPETPNETSDNNSDNNSTSSEEPTSSSSSNSGNDAVSIILATVRRISYDPSQGRVLGARILSLPETGKFDIKSLLISLALLIFGIKLRNFKTEHSSF